MRGIIAFKFVRVCTVFTVYWTKVYMQYMGRYYLYINHATSLQFMTKPGTLKCTKGRGEGALTFDNFLKN